MATFGPPLFHWLRSSVGRFSPLGSAGIFPSSISTPLYIIWPICSVTILTACSRVTGLAIGAPALIAASCLITGGEVSPRYRFQQIHRLHRLSSRLCTKHGMIWATFPNFRQSLKKLERHCSCQTVYSALNSQRLRVLAHDSIEVENVVCAKGAAWSLKAWFDLSSDDSASGVEGGGGGQLNRPSGVLIP